MNPITGRFYDLAIKLWDQAMDNVIVRGQGLAHFPGEFLPEATTVSDVSKEECMNSEILRFGHNKLWY
jgi:hypothetical protein